jgi:hypothetical protein
LLLLLLSLELAQQGVEGAAQPVVIVTVEAIFLLLDGQQGGRGRGRRRQRAGGSAGVDGAGRRRETGRRRRADGSGSGRQQRAEPAEARQKQTVAAEGQASARHVRPVVLEGRAFENALETVLVDLESKKNYLFVVQQMTHQYAYVRIRNAVPPIPLTFPNMLVAA